MLKRPSTELNLEDQVEIIDEQSNGSQQNSLMLTEPLPNELLLAINDDLPSHKDKVRLSSVNRLLHGLFQPEIGKKEAHDAAGWAIYPIEENVARLKTLLKECPALLFHPVTVKNRHDMVIKGTVYQIALHESDDELIDDVITPAFQRLHNGLETMEAQRQKWLPEGWLEEEEKTCEGTCKTIDDVFTAFKNASNPNDVTELPYPFTITIKNLEINIALDTFRKAIAALYTPTNKVIESGRDTSIRLMERVMGRYQENYDAFGGYDAPRNNALIRAVYGYCQRWAPINFMQAFAMGVFSIVENKEKLIRSFEYRGWRGHFILPLDGDPLFRLGYDIYAQADGCGPGFVCAGVSWCRTFFQSIFVNQKQLLYTPANAILKP